MESYKILSIGLYFIMQSALSYFRLIIQNFQCLFQQLVHMKNSKYNVGLFIISSIQIYTTHIQFYTYIHPHTYMYIYTYNWSCSQTFSAYFSDETTSIWHSNSKLKSLIILSLVLLPILYNIPYQLGRRHISNGTLPLGRIFRNSKVRNNNLPPHILLPALVPINKNLMVTLLSNIVRMQEQTEQVKIINM